MVARRPVIADTHTFPITLRLRNARLKLPSIDSWDITLEGGMPRALNRDEQAIMNFVRRSGGSTPVTELAKQLSIAPDTAQTACEYLIGRGLLSATVYAVGVPVTAKSGQGNGNGAREAAVSA